MLSVFAESAGGGFGPEGPESENQGSVAALGAVDARLLWAIRRLALMQPIGAARCHNVHIALQQDFGDAGMGIEHLLRCILVGLSRVATRQLVVGTPGCGLLLPDEAALLAVIEGKAGRTALVAVAGSAEAAGLVPLFDAVAVLVRK